MIIKIKVDSFIKPNELGLIIIDFDDDKERDLCIFYVVGDDFNEALNEKINLLLTKRDLIFIVDIKMN